MFPRPRVLLLLHALTRTGAPRIALEAFQKFSSDFEIRIMAPEAGPLLPECESIGPVCLWTYPFNGSRWHRLTAALQHRRKLQAWRSWRPDLIYVNSLAALGQLRLLRLAEGLQPPVLLHVHELESLMDRLLEFGDRTLLLERPARYIAVSTAVEKALTARGVEPSRISLVHEFTRHELTEGPPAAREQSEQRFVIGGSGDVSWRKGATLWLETAVELQRLRPDALFHFLWVGQSYEKTFQIRARKLGVEVEFPGEVENAQAYYAQFDVFFLSSWEDPCPLVVFETMALGKPVVCFAGSGGAPEQVGVAGIVVEEFHPRQAAEALLQLMDDPVQRAELSRRARLRVREHFTDRTQIPKLRAVVDQMLAG